MTKLIHVFGTAIVIALALLIIIFVFQRRLIYFPSPRSVPEGVSLTAGARELEIPTADNLVLGATWVPARQNSDLATVIVFNGNAGDRFHRAPLAESLAALGYSALLFDYRGYGGNPGGPSEQGLLRDARAVRSYLTNTMELDPSRLVYFGESLGTGVAVALAHEHEPAALILRSPFTSLVDVGRFHYPVLPVSLLLRDRFDSAARIADVSCPVLVIVGDQDRIVPSGLSRKLYDAVQSPKRWLEIPGVGHNHPSLLAGNELVTAAASFIQEQRGAR